MPTLTLSSTTVRTDTIGSSPPIATILAGRDPYGIGDCASGLQIDLPIDMTGVHFNSAVLSLMAVDRNDYLSSYYIRVGVPANETAFAAQDFATASLHLPQLFRSNHFAGSPPLPAETLQTSSTAHALDLTAMLTQAAAAGRMTDDLQIAFALHTVWDDQFSPFWAEFSGFSLAIDYSILPIRISVPASIRAGESLPASVRRLAADPSPLAVTLTQSPSGRLILPATVTIPADETEEDFVVTGATAGTVTVTADDGTNEHEQDLTVLPAIPDTIVGLGDEMRWWCPSLDAAGDGTATLHDLAGNVDGTLVGMSPATAWVTDGGTRALQFSGGNNHIAIGTLTAPEWTIAAWIKIDGFDAVGYRRILGTTGFRVDFATTPAATKLLAVVDTSWRTFGSELPVNTWLHVAATYNGTQLRGYVGGAQAGTTLTAGRSLTGQTARLGDYVRGSTNDDGNQFRGLMDDIRIFPRAIDAAEVAHLASARGAQGVPAPAGGGPRRSRLRRHRINAGLIT